MVVDVCENWWCIEVEIGFVFFGVVDFWVDIGVVLGVVFDCLLYLDDFVGFLFECDDCVVYVVGWCVVVFICVDVD